jgi:hypothetical protein
MNHQLERRATMEEFDKAERTILYEVMKAYLLDRQKKGLEIGDIEYTIFGKLIISLR